MSGTPVSDPVVSRVTLRPPLDLRLYLYKLLDEDYVAAIN